MVHVLHLKKFKNGIEMRKGLLYIQVTSGHPHILYIKRCQTYSKGLKNDSTKHKNTHFSHRFDSRSKCYGEYYRIHKQKLLQTIECVADVNNSNYRSILQQI